jgi:hypothetical protein
MNSDLMPLPESSNQNSASNQDPTNQEAAINANGVTPAIDNQNSQIHSHQTANNGNLPNRSSPIPPPSEPMQYRAIGLVRGRYIASSEQFTQGIMVTTDGMELEAVLLGRIMSLVKNHLSLEQEHLWVVYPRTRQKNDKLHLQIVGVWEPENLAKHQLATDQEQDVDLLQHQLTDNNSSNIIVTSSSNIPDGGFSVRGEVVYQAFEPDNLVIKIKQAPRKPHEKPKYFKLKLKGKLEIKAVGKFWDLQVKRDADTLVIESGELIADLPKKGRPFQTKGRRPNGFIGKGKKSFAPKRSSGEIQRPIRKTADSPVTSRPIPIKPTPKPIKRPKPPQK